MLMHLKDGGTKYADDEDECSEREIIFFLSNILNQNIYLEYANAQYQRSWNRTIININQQDSNRISPKSDLEQTICSNLIISLKEDFKEALTHMKKDK